MSDIESTVVDRVAGVAVRYLVTDVAEAVAFYTGWLGFDVEHARLRAAGLRFRNDVVRGRGGSQVLLEDPSGNLVELFQPAR